MTYYDTVLKYLVFTGALHGFYLVVILLTTQARTKSPYSWLIAIILGAFGLYLTNKFVYLSGNDVLTAYLSGTSMPFLYLVGPSYWLYLQFITGIKSKWVKMDLIHLVPMVICFLAASPYYFMDCTIKLEYIMSLDRHQIDLPLQRGFYFGGHLVQTLFYLALSFSTVNRFKSSIQRQTREFVLIRNWTARTYGFMVTLAVIYFVSFSGFIFFSEGRVFFRDLFGLSITGFIHLIGFWIIKDSPILSHSKATNTEINHADKLLKERILELMKTKPYLNPDYSLKNISDSLNTNTVYASQMINLLFDKSFTELVNQYRVEEVKVRMTNNPDEKLLAVALESGFSNKNTFTRVFKKYTGVTPSEYRDSLKK